MRQLTLTGIAALMAVGLFAALPAAAFGDDGGGAPQVVAASRSDQAEAPRADRLQQALAACRARGFADGSDDQRRCAERLLGGSAAPTSPPPTRAPAPAPAPRGPVVTDRAIVQSAQSGTLVLRAFDGSSIVIPVDALTRTAIGDRPATATDIQPGTVATVRHQDGGPALDIRVALPPRPKLRSDRGITERVSPTGMVIRVRDGSAIQIAIGRSTRLEAPNGRAAAPADLRVGVLVDVLYDPAGATPAQSVKIIRRVS